MSDTFKIDEVEVVAICSRCSRSFGIPATFETKFGEQKEGIWLCPRCGRGTNQITKLVDDTINPEILERLIYGSEIVPITDRPTFVVYPEAYA